MENDKPEVWRTVQRKKYNRNSEITTFYVGNLPEGISNNELRNTFMAYGNVVDTYVAYKKDKGGLNFGFVKFAGVNDATNLESSFEKICLSNNILSINIARFQRKMPVFHPQNQNGNRKHVHIPPPASAWNLKGTRSFANVVSDATATPKATSRIIHLSPSEDTDKTLFSSFLFGEANDLETLKAIPSLLKDAGIMHGKIYYYGGLCALIGFDGEVDASGLLGNVECWKQWFVWLKRGDSILNWKFERIIDVKIIGLPMQFRSIVNFQKILSHHGRILEMGDDNIWKYEDLSYVNVSILTESKTKINEDITIVHGNGKQFSIGLVEDTWFLNPFNEDILDVNDKHSEMGQDSDDENSSEDGISDTFSINSGKDMPMDFEEGEIPPESDGANNFPVDDVVIEESQFNIVEDGANGVGNTDNACNINSPKPTPAHGNFFHTAPIAVSFSSPPEGVIPMHENSVNIPTHATSIPTFGVPWTPQLDMGSNYGPFRATAPVGSISNISPIYGSKSKKRRRQSPDKNLKAVGSVNSPMTTQSLMSKSSIDLNKKVISMEGCESSNVGLCSNSHSSTPQIVKTGEVGNDVGFVIPVDNILAGEVSSCDSTHTSHVSPSQEMVETVRIGNELGFTITVDDPALREIILGAGANKTN